MDQVAGLNHMAADLDRTAELDYMCVCLGNRGAPGEKGKPKRFHRFQIPNSAIRNASFALQRLRNGRVNLTYQGSECGDTVDVLEDHDPRLG
jgi:hypothetical protein